MQRAFSGLVLLSVFALAQDSRRSTSQLLFNDPPTLQAAYPNGVPNSQAMFGDPAYGPADAITGVVVYAARGDHDACEAFDRSNVTNWPTTGQAVIVMIDRGECSFVTKVRHAQEAGASAAIIVDNRDEPGLPLMADDNTGGDILIPSMLIHQDAGAVIKNNMKYPVEATMSWNLPHPDGRVEWELWTSSDDTTTELFKKQFEKASQALGNATLLTPHYFFIDGRWTDCMGASRGSPNCVAQCINDGRYCAPDPEQDITIGVTGVQVIEENLRQMCLYQQHVADLDDASLWFEYVVKFDAECVDPEKWTSACSSRIITELGLDPAPVNKCVEDSNLPNGTNTLIDQELRLQIASGVFYNPTIIVNNVPYRGALICPDPIERSTCALLNAICTGYAEGTMPDACASGCPVGQSRNPCGTCGDGCIIDECGQKFQNANASGWNQCFGCDGKPNSGKVKDHCGVCDGPGEDMCGRCFPVGDPFRVDEGSGKSCPTAGFPLWGVIVIVFSVVIVVGVSVAVIMRKREESMRADIDDLLQQYMPMDSQQQTGFATRV